MKKFKTYLIALFLCGASALFASNAFADNSLSSTKGIKIVASIKPLALLIQEITSDNDSVEVVLESNQDHHFEHLKPSQRQKVDKADVIFYINDGFELFIEKARESDSDDYKFIQMSETPGLRLLSLRESGELPHLAHENNARRLRDQYNHDHSGIDWHIWLNPDNAILMLRKVRDELTKLRPENKVLYQERYDIFSQHLISYSNEKAQMIMKVLNSPFFVLHDGFQYFEEQYGLESKGTILRHGQTAASANHVNELRKIRQSAGVTVVIKEEQYSDRAINNLAGGMPLKVVSVDSLAQGSLSNHEDYISYNDAIVEIIFKGLKK